MEKGAEMKRFFFICMVFLSVLQAELNLDQEWKFTTKQSIKTPPLIEGRSAYLSSYDGSLYKIDLNSGKEAWHFQTECFVSSRAIVDDGRVFIGSGDGYFYALDSENGHLLWKFKTLDMITRTGIIFQGMVVFGGADGYIYALNKNNGKLIWKKKLNFSICADLLYVNNLLYVSTIDKKIYAINIKNQKIIWTYLVKERVTIKPIYEDSILFISDEGVNITAIDINTGSRVWSFESSSETSMMKIKNKYLYLSSLDNTVRIINKSTGKLRKSYFADDDISTLAVEEEFFVLGTDSGYLVFLDNDYNLIYDKKINTRVSSLQFFNNRLYITDIEGSLYTFSYSFYRPQLLTPPSLPPPPLIVLKEKKIVNEGIDKEIFELFLKKIKIDYKQINSTKYKILGDGFTGYLSLRMCKNKKCHLIQMFSLMNRSSTSHKNRLIITNNFNKHSDFVRAIVDSDDSYRLISELDLNLETTFEDLKLFIKNHREQHYSLAKKI